jgi:hypothetical protein
MAKCEVQGTVRRPRRRQEDNISFDEIYDAANILHTLSIMNEVCTNVY